MALKTEGIHHITAIAGDPQENVDFYGGVLGLRMTKKTVNHDDPETYHTYFSNGNADVGTHITFFPWENGEKGKIGTGQVGVTYYMVPKGALPFWKKRFDYFKVSYAEAERFGETYLFFEDYHGLKNALVERKSGEKSTYEFGEVTNSVAIKGFAGAALFSDDPDKTVRLIKETMGFKKIDDSNDYMRFSSSAVYGNTIDINNKKLERGIQGVGTVHHIAFRARDEDEQVSFRKELKTEGYHVTPVIDRKYFKSIYFREQGKILFEIATEGPGFDVDEPFDKLGESLTLPQRYEPYRDKITKRLKPIRLKRPEEF